jgi:ribosomal protein L16/L10AE
MGKEVQIKLKVHLLRVVRKKPLILKVNQVRDFGKGKGKSRG